MCSFVGPMASAYLCGGVLLVCVDLHLTLQLYLPRQIESYVIFNDTRLNTKAIALSLKCKSLHIPVRMRRGLGVVRTLPPAKRSPRRAADAFTRCSIFVYGNYSLQSWQRARKSKEGIENSFNEDSKGWFL